MVKEFKIVTDTGEINITNVKLLNLLDYITKINGNVLINDKKL